MSLEVFAHFFKPEVRSSGQSFVSKDKVTLSQPSDMEIQSYVKAAKPFRVSLKLESFASPLLHIDCTCPQSNKGQFCKHMWAALLKVEEKKSEFLETKSDLQKGPGLRVDVSPQQEAFKKKQTDYRKEQYQKQKLRMKEFKKGKKSSEPAIEFPADIQEALNYFEKNGFPLKESLTKEAINIAMKKLARVFHPDRGGTHQEILELNNFSEILAEFAQS